MIKRILSVLVVTASLLCTGVATAAEEEAPSIHVTLLTTSHGLFDPGIHLFVDGSYLPTASLRATYDVVPHVGVEAGYSFSELSGSPSAVAGGLFTTHIAEAGLRYESPVVLGPIVPYARAGATLWMSRTHFIDGERYTQWATTFGVYGAAGLRVGTSLRDVFGQGMPDVGLGFTAEIGHLQTFNDLKFGPFGTLETGGVFFGYGVEVGF